MSKTKAFFDGVDTVLMRVGQAVWFLVFCVVAADCASKSDKLEDEIASLTRANNNAQTSMRDMCDAIHTANSEIADHNAEISETDYLPVDNVRVPAECMR